MLKKIIGIVAFLVVALIITAGTVKATHIPLWNALICPDYDRDGVVTKTDVLVVADHFGTYPGSPPNNSGQFYSARYDLNHDGRIDLSDILRAISLVGQKCPYTRW